MVQPTICEEKESSVSPTGSTMMARLEKKRTLTVQWAMRAMNEAASVGRCIGDGNFIACAYKCEWETIDGTHCFRCITMLHKMSPNIVAHYDLRLEEEIMYLEPVDEI